MIPPHYPTYPGNPYPVPPVYNQPAYVASTYVPYVHASSAYGPLQPTSIAQPMTGGLVQPYYPQFSAPNRLHLGAYPAANFAAPARPTKAATVELEPAQQTAAFPTANNSVAPQYEPQNFHQQQIYDWLKRIGMHKYFHLFMQHGFDDINKVKEMKTDRDIDRIGIPCAYDMIIISRQIENMQKEHALHVDMENLTLSNVLQKQPKQDVMDLDMDANTDDLAERVLLYVLWSL